MSDLIDRQAAIDAVHDEFDGCLVWDESGEHTANEVEGILDNVPSAQPEQRWIPCSERLPGTDGEYLACDGDCVFFSRLFQGEFLSDDVNAWMPLPEPYKGEQE